MILRLVFLKCQTQTARTCSFFNIQWTVLYPSAFAVPFATTFISIWTLENYLEFVHQESLWCVYAFTLAYGSQSFNSTGEPAKNLGKNRSDQSGFPGSLHFFSKGTFYRGAVSILYIPRALSSANVLTMASYRLSLLICGIGKICAADNILWKRAHVAA